MAKSGDAFGRRRKYYVVAPDQRGLARATGWDDRFNGDLQAKFHGLRGSPLTLSRSFVRWA